MESKSSYVVTSTEQELRRLQIMKSQDDALRASDVLSERRIKELDYWTAKFAEAFLIADSLRESANAERCRTSERGWSFENEGEPIDVRRFDVGEANGGCLQASTKRSLLKIN